MLPSSLVISARTPPGESLGEIGQVERGLGVAAAREHAAALRAQREDVPGPRQVVRLCGRIDQRADGRRAISGGDAGGRAGARVDGDGEGGAQRFGVVRDHQRDLERIEALGRAAARRAVRWCSEP